MGTNRRQRKEKARKILRHVYDNTIHMEIKQIIDKFPLTLTDLIAEGLK